MKIRFSRDWNGYVKGEVIDADYNLGEVYVENGYAERIETLRTSAGPSLPDSVEKRKRGRPPLMRS